MRIEGTTINLILRVMAPSTTDSITVVVKSCEQEIDYFGISELFSKDGTPQQNGSDLPRAEKAFLSTEVVTSITRTL